MMKKNGFTLAEVLITLAIIGVVATMTLPALMTNTQEQQAKTGLKKGINTLTEAAQMNQAIGGFDYASLTEKGDLATDLTDNVSFEGLISNNTLIDKGQTNVIKSQGLTSFTPDKTIYFRDGSAVIYAQANTLITATVAQGSEGVGSYQADGMPLGFTVVYDTNGAKLPNILSNCSGTATGADESASGKNAFKGQSLDLTNCNSKTKRVIKDQFLVQLRGGYAVPLGEASTWVMSEAKGKTAEKPKTN